MNEERAEILEAIKGVVKSRKRDTMMVDIILANTIRLLTPREPIVKDDICFCGNCMYCISKKQNFCHKCGTEVQWR